MLSSVADALMAAAVVFAICGFTTLAVIFVVLVIVWQLALFVRAGLDTSTLLRR